MSRYRSLASAVVLMGGMAAGLAGCKDFLTAGETSRNPNQPTTATATQYFVAVQSNLWAIYTGHVSRVTAMWAQHFHGADDSYADYDRYQIDEDATNGIHRSLYTTGGLVDVRKMQQLVRNANDSLFLGITQVQEAMLIGFGADVFGDLTYSRALGPANPPLDPQLAVYDSVQVLLSHALKNIGNRSTDVGPGNVDLVYGGNWQKWLKLANTLKARFFMHTVQVRPLAYDSVLKYAPDGIRSNADDYLPLFSGNFNESSLWRQFWNQRPTAMLPGMSLDSMLRARTDPRRSNYFVIGSNDTASNLSTLRLGTTYRQPMATANETLLLWAEAAYRDSDPTTARARLIDAKTLAGVSTVGTPMSGVALLRDILAEKYIATFQLGVEAWMDYRRTCFPNLNPRTPGGTMPGRLYYDADERQTNSNIPQVGTAPNGLRNAVDSPNTTSDQDGTACKAGA